MSKEEYHKVALRLKELEKEVAEAQKNTVQSWKARNPDIALKVGLKTEARSYIKREVSFSKVLPKIMERLLWQGWAKKTQKEILDDVQKLFPQQEILANVWTKELEPWAFKKAQTIIEASMQRPINIKGCKTLSDIKRRLKAATLATDDMQVYLPKIGISSAALIINKKPYDIDHTRKHPSFRISVNGKHVWLRVDALIELLNK